MAKNGRIFIIIFVSIILLQSLSAVDIVSTGSKEVTAYKHSYTDQVPDMVYAVRVIDPDSVEVSDDVVINIPESSRRADYQAFSWILSGNVYGTVSVSLTFSPMYWEKDSQNGMIIPYEVSFSHVSSRVGNTMIPVGRYPTQSATAFNNGFTDYDYYYCDDVAFYDAGGSQIPATAVSDYALKTNSTVSVNSVPKTVNVRYNITTYTKIYKNSVEIDSYGYEVCDYWNRRGNAYVNLAITDDSKHVDTHELYDNGMYYATVVITVSKD